jgi:hypothetical protein
MALRPRRVAIVATVLLGGAIVAAVSVLRQTPRPPQDVARDEPSGANGGGDRFLGCLRQIGRDSFSLAVSRVLPHDPLRIETYGLIGSGGLTLSDHVEHTIEVLGTLEPSGDPFPRLRVSSARHVATYCWKP